MAIGLPTKTFIDNDTSVPVSAANLNTLWATTKTLADNYDADLSRSFYKNIGQMYGGTPCSTGLSINASHGGKVYLIMGSGNNGSENFTAAFYAMIRCGYDGNNFSAVNIASSGSASFTFTQAEGILYITAGVDISNVQLRIDANK